MLNEEEIEVPGTAERKLASRFLSLVAAFVVGALVVGLSSYIYLFVVEPPGRDMELSVYCFLVPGMAILGGVYGFTAYFLYHTIRFRKPHHLLKILLAVVVLIGPVVGLTGILRVWGWPFLLYLALVTGIAILFVRDK